MTYSFDFLIFGDGSVVDECVVVKEESAGDIESYEDINAVVLVSGQDEKDSKAVAEPSECVEEEDSSTGVFSDEEVEEREGDRVTREHIVTTGPHTWNSKLGSVFQSSDSTSYPAERVQLRTK